MRDLPPILSKVRFKIPAALQPRVVIALSFDPFNFVSDLIVNHGRPDENFTLHLSFWSNFWIEWPRLVDSVDGRIAKGMAMHVTLDPQKESFSDSRVKLYNHDGEKRSDFIIGDYFLVDTPLNPSPDFEPISGCCMSLAYALHYLHMRHDVDATEDIVQAIDRRAGNRKPTVFMERVGDTIRFQTVRFQSIAHKRIHGEREPKSGEPSHHKRQHEVIGHYRHYKSSKVAFIRAHKRGDPTLGIITKVYQVK